MTNQRPRRPTVGVSGQEGVGTRGVPGRFVPLVFDLGRRFWGSGACVASRPCERETRSHSGPQKRRGLQHLNSILPEPALTLSARRCSLETDETGCLAASLIVGPKRSRGKGTMSVRGEGVRQLLNTLRIRPPRPARVPYVRLRICVSVRPTFCFSLLH